MVAFNPYDYPSGLERANWFARFIGTSIRLPGSGTGFRRDGEPTDPEAACMRGGFADPHKLPEDFLVELRRSGSRKGYPTVARAIYRSLNGFIEARPRYPDVAVPVTLAYSEQDWSRPAEREAGGRLAADSVETITLPDTGHFSALERPTEMARILLQRTKTAADS